MRFESGPASGRNGLRDRGADVIGCGLLAAGRVVTIALAQGAGPTQLVAGFDDHFFVQDASGAHRLEIGGLLQVHGGFFERGVERENELFLRRFRLEIGGRIEDRWLFNLEPKFTAGEVELEEAWFGFDWSDARVMLGRMKEPFGLDEVIPLKHIPTVNQSILNQFVPAEGHGITLYGESFARRLDWGAAVYQGGSDGINGGTEGAARLVLRPWAASGCPAVEGFQIGGAATIGRAHEMLDGDELRTEAREPFALFATGSELDGDRTRLGAEAAWLAGPFELLAEWMRADYDLDGPAGSDSARLEGAYVAAAWVVTGEKRTFKGVRPARPFAGVPEDGRGCGAVELVGRVSRLNLDDGFTASGVLAAGSDPDRVDSVGVGVNWFPTWRTAVKLHGLFTDYRDPVAVGGRSIGRERALLLQLQLHF